MPKLLAAVLVFAMAAPALAAEFTLAPPPPGRMITGQFTQSTPSGTKSTGRFWIAARGEMRWEQSAPYDLLLVSSGGSVWQVEPDLNQAILQNLPDDDLFSALQKAKLKSDASQPGVFRGTLDGLGGVEVHMDQRAALPSLVVQPEQGLTTRFSRVRTVLHDPSLFRYSPPARMDVIR